MGHKGHYGEYSGNAKWSRDHAHTKVTKENYDASERDDAAHVDYLERDVKDDQRTGGKYKDENQTADEKHISKLEGDMKYDKEHHGSPAKNIVGMARRAGDQVSELVATQRPTNSIDIPATRLGKKVGEFAKFALTLQLPKKLGKALNKK